AVRIGQSTVVGARSPVYGTFPGWATTGARPRDPGTFTALTSSHARKQSSAVPPTARKPGATMAPTMGTRTWANSDAMYEKPPTMSRTPSGLGKYPDLTTRYPSGNSHRPKNMDAMR